MKFKIGDFVKWERHWPDHHGLYAKGIIIKVNREAALVYWYATGIRVLKRLINLRRCIDARNVR